MNLREVVSAIRREVIQGTKQSGASEDLIRLRIAAADMRAYSQGVGRMPPSPGTPRARAGAYLVRMVRRMLFWYTPQVVRFNVAAADFAAQACTTLERLSRSQEDTAFDSFVSEFRRQHFPADRELVFRELRDTLILSGLVPGCWLDIECGAGHWMSSIGSDVCEDIRGVEPNGAEAALCTAAGLKAMVMDPLRFLSGQPTASFAVITAFRVPERHPMPWNLELIGHCARCLLPGGTLLIATADSGAAEFPGDPCRICLVPLPMLRAMVEHVGLTVSEVKRLPGGEHAILARRP